MTNDVRELALTYAKESNAAYGDANYEDWSALLKRAQETLDTSQPARFEPNPDADCAFYCNECGESVLHGDAGWFHNGEGPHDHLPEPEEGHDSNPGYGEEDDDDE